MFTLVLTLITSCLAGRRYINQNRNLSSYCTTTNEVISEIKQSLANDSYYSKYNFAVQYINATYSDNIQMTKMRFSLIDNKKQQILNFGIDVKKQQIFDFSITPYKNLKTDKSQLSKQEFPIDSDEIINISLSYLKDEQKNHIKYIEAFVENDFWKIFVYSDISNEFPIEICLERDGKLISYENRNTGESFTE